MKFFKLAYIGLILTLIFSKGIAQSFNGNDCVLLSWENLKASGDTICLPNNKYGHRHGIPMTQYEANEDEGSLEVFLKNETSYTRHYGVVDPDKNYWAKLNIKAGQNSQDTLLFFPCHLSGFYTWNYIDAYLVHENGRIEKQKTGFPSAPFWRFSL